MITIRGQTSTEYVVLLAASLFFFIFVLFIISDQVALIGRTKAAEAARTAVQSIAAAARSVYYQGVGARQFIYVTFPEGTDEGSPRIINNTVTLRHYRSDISYKTDFPIYGSLPSASGAYLIEIISEGTSVRIGVPPFLSSPSSLLLVGCVSSQTQVLSTRITFMNNQNISTPISLSVSWSAAGISITLSNYSLSLPVGGSQNVTVNATIASNITGTYSGKIVANTTNYSMDIPITVVMQTCGGLPISYLTIMTYKDQYATESSNFTLPPNVTITTGNWSAGSWITIKIIDPSAQTTYENTAQTNSTGGYSFVWPAVGPLGTYTINVNDSATLVNTTFSLVSCP